MRAALSSTLREEDFAVTIPLARAVHRRRGRLVAEHDLPWSVQRLGCRAEYWFSPPPRDGATAAAAGDHELEAYFHLHALNRGVLLTPFHNMALFTPQHTDADVDRHTDVFAEAVDPSCAPVATVARRDGTSLRDRHRWLGDEGGAGRRPPELIDERYKIVTPQPAMPDAMADVVGRLLDHFGPTGLSG